MATVLVLFNVAAGADSGEYEEWAREVDVPPWKASSRWTGCGCSKLDRFSARIRFLLSGTSE